MSTPPRSDPRPEPRKRPQQARSRITVEAILEGAFQVLVAEGFDGLTTTRVAERAGVSVGTLYQYYPDKEALVAALIDAHLAAEAAAIADVFADAQTAPLPELSDRLVDAFVGLNAAQPERSAALVDGAARVQWEAGLDALAGQVADGVAAVLEMRADEVEAENPALAAFVTVHAVDGLVRRAVWERPEDMASGAVAAEARALVRAYLWRR